MMMVHNYVSGPTVDQESSSLSEDKLVQQYCSVQQP